MSQGPHVLVQRIAVNITLLFTLCEEGEGNVFIQLTYSSHLMNILLRIQVFGGLWCSDIGSNSPRIIILGLLDPCRWRHCVPLKHGNRFLNNTVSHRKRPEFSTTPVWKPQIAETYCSLHVEVMLVKLNTLHLEYFISDHLHCEDYYYTTYNLLCPISKNLLVQIWQMKGPLSPPYYSVTKTIL